jgi:hypothetical protein
MNIRLINYRGRQFWQWENTFGWSIESVKFIRYLLRERGYSGDAIDDLIASASPVDAVPRILLTRLTHRAKSLGFRVGTWIGERFAREPEIRRFLKANSFNADEIESLIAVADSAVVAANDQPLITSQLAYGIRH